MDYEIPFQFKAEMIFWALVIRNKVLKDQMIQRIISKDKGLLVVLDHTEQNSL